MANYNKSFNLRNGVQVDEDDLIVRGSLVGIGTTLPRNELDVIGSVRVSGVVTSPNLYVTGIATLSNVQIGTGITIDGNAGIITATFVGNGAGLYNIPTSQWVDVNPSTLPVGAAYSSIYAAGTVGIATTVPNFYLQIGGNANVNQKGVGIDSTGNIILSGVVTSLTGFVGSGAGVTSINASNISSGTLDNARLPSSLNITGVVSATGLRATGIATIGFATITSAYIGVATVGFINADVFQTGGLSIGVATITTANITTANVGFASITNQIVGVGTFDTIDSRVGIISQFNNTFQVSGTSTITNLRSSNAYIGLGTFDSLTGTSLRVTGIGTIVNFVGTSASVGFVTSNLSWIGVATASNIRSGNIRISFSDANTIESTTGTITVGNLSDQVIISNNISVTGVTTLGDQVTLNTGIVPDTNAGAYIGQLNSAFGAAFIDNISIGDGLGNDNTIKTTSGDLNLDANSSTVKILNNFYSSGVSTFVGQAILNTGIVPDANNNGYIGQPSRAFGEVFIDNVAIGYGVGNDNKVSTTSGNLVLDSSTGIVNVSDKFIVTGISTFNGEVVLNTGVIPDSDGAYLGSSSRKFNSAFVDNITIGDGSGKDNTIGSLSGGITLDSNSGYVTIDDALRVTGLSTFNSQVQLTTGLVPVTSNTAYVGTSALPIGDIYVGNIRLGVSGDNIIDTSSGDLYLNSTTNTVVFTGNVNISGISTFNSQTVFNTGIVPETASGAYVGTSALPWLEGYFGNLRLLSNNLTSTSGGITLDSNSGYVTIDDALRVTGLSTFNSQVQLTTGLVPVSSNTAYVGTSGLPFSSLYVGQLIASSNTVTTQSGNLNLDSNSQLVNINNRLIVTGISTFQSQVTVDTGIIPDSNLGAYFGSSANSFGPAYLSNITVGVGSTGQISTKIQDLELTSNTNLVKVNSRLLVTGQSYFTGISTFQSNLVPQETNTGSVGIAEKPFQTAYFGNVTIGSGTSNSIGTLSETLVLGSGTNTVQVNNKLVSQSINVSDTIIANNNIIIDGNNSNIKVGIGTTIPSTSLDIRVNSGDAISQIVSPSGSAIVSLGQSGYGNNNIGFISYNGSILQISNTDVGDIRSTLHSGSPGVGTGDFIWTYGQDNSRLMTLTYQGNLGLGGISNPSYPLHVSGISTVDGDSYVSGSLSVGSTIFGTVAFPDNLIQNNNVLTESGISTFWKIGISSTFYVEPQAKIGINTDPLSLPKNPVNGDVIFGVEGKTLFSNVGIGTTVGISTSVPIPALHVVGEALFDGIYIGTDRYYTEDTQNIHIFDANLIVHGDTNGCQMTFEATNANFDSNSSLRFGTSSGGVVDFGNAGAVGLGTTVRYMVPPKLTSAERTGLASTVAGAFIFNTTTNKHQGYNGTAWFDFY